MLFATHNSPLNALAITPDGTQIISAANNGIIVWDRTTAEVVHHLKGHTTAVQALAVTPSGDQIISASVGGTVRTWDRTTGQQIGEPYVGHRGYVLALTPDGNEIISGTEDGELIVWDRNDTNEFGRMIPVHDSAIMAVAATQDGGVVSVSRANTPRFTNVTTGESTDIEGGGASSAITAIAFSPAGDGLYCGQADGVIMAWDTGESMIPGQNGRVQSLAFTADGHLLASAGSNGIVRVWSPDFFGQIGNSLTGHTGSVRAVVFTPDGGQIFAAGEDGTVHVWDSPGREAFCQHGSKVRAVAAGADRIISGGEDGLVKVWDRNTGTLVNTLTGHSGSIVMVALHGNEIVSAANDGVRLWSAISGELLAHREAYGTSAAALSADGAEIIFLSESGQIQFWDRPHGRTGTELASGAKNVQALAFTPDRTQIILGGADGVVGIWDRDTHQRTGSATPHTLNVLTLTVTADGSQIISGAADGSIHIWDRSSGRTEVLTGHESAVLSVAVTPDGDRIVSSGPDGTVRLWDTASGQLIETYAEHTGAVNSVAVDRSQAVSGGQDGTVRIRNLTAMMPVGRADPLAEVVSDLESEQDRLGITGDVNMIAAVVGALSTTPPLSIALLGDWGAGKSSFMRQVLNRVEVLRRRSVGADSSFAENVRQVRFNAWHYSDDHLWVGLVEHLFRELAEPARGDDTARRRELEEQLSTAKAERDRLAEELRAVERKRGLLAPLRSVQVARATVAGLWRELWSGGWRTWLALLILGAGAAGVVFGAGVIRWLCGVVAVLGPTVVAWKKVSEYTEAARRRLVDRKFEVDKDIREVESELTKVDPARRLDKLLKEISTADRYESYRGLTGKIHHDLRRLSEDLKKAREQWDGSGRPPLQRIVLYVDDLDRCTPRRVVDVLNAVNLLLTMDLFVVVVAVDPRWLLKSLQLHHEGLFDANEVAYLDKIFHIPVALRPMGDRAVTYLRSLLPIDEVPAPRQPEVQEVEQVAESGAPVQPTPQPVSKATVPSKVVVRPRPAELNPEGLRLRGQEKEFLERLTPLLGTPRAIKKLVNLYRLLRLGVGEAGLREFIGGEQGGPYQAAALLLAALVGTPQDARKLLQGLASADGDRDIVETIPSPGLRDLIVRIRRDVPVHGSTGTYKQWARTVARYGFETYDLFEG